LLEQLQDAIEDKEHLIIFLPPFCVTRIVQDEKDRAQIELHDKFSASREKYKVTKKANQELQSVSYFLFFNVILLRVMQAPQILHDELTDTTSQRDKAEKRDHVSTPYSTTAFDSN
jgi:hypothetical protein